MPGPCPDSGGVTEPDTFPGLKGKGAAGDAVGNQHDLFTFLHSVLKGKKGTDGASWGSSDNFLSPFLLLFFLLREQNWT